MFHLFSKFLAHSFAVFFLLSLGSYTAAQTIPELTIPSTLTGATTTARFSAGVRVGEEFVNALTIGNSMELIASVAPESDHIGAAGTIYLLAIAGGKALALASDGSWIDFDGTLQGLGEAQAISSLSGENEISVNEIETLFSRPGVQIDNGVVSVSLFVAYDTSAAIGELFFSGSPLQFSLTDSALVRERQLPELLTPAAASGALTTAKFFGGASIDSLATFPSLFQATDTLSIQLEVEPEFAHLGASGTVYALAVVGNVFFTLLETGEWIPFDGTVAGLGGAASIAELENVHRISADSAISLLEGEGVQVVDGNVSIQIYVAYDTAANPGELYFSGAPLMFSVAVADNSSASALEIFESSIEQQVVQARCVACHAEGGIASATGLVFERSSASSSTANYSVLESYVASRTNARDTILSKVTGGLSHGGGVQLPNGGTDFNNLSAMLDALISPGGSGGVVTASASFFSGVALQSNEKTLRRAAIMLAGRAPTDQEIQAVRSGGEDVLRSVLKGLMTGDAFHRFLVDGANDRLLVRGVPDNTFLDGGGVFPVFTNRWIELSLQALEQGRSFTPELGELINGTDHGLRNSPLELIAHVVENELPYGEILTADYMMLNPIANFSVEGTASFTDPSDMNEFQPGRFSKVYTGGEQLIIEDLPEVNMGRVIQPGLSWDYPHSGVLNTQAFLFRYPTTATNRNRARARWTFLHFLDFDIERSAQRTTDPVALADTNNPTMFNENCTVCHATMDPVAGAFQDYGDEGHFKVNSEDSLDNFYKYPDDGDTPYQEGDTWYRDMRAPGIFGSAAPANTDSLQWLANQIVQDPNFSKASIKFWWPAFFGQEAMLAPTVETDANFEAALLAYDAQAESIQQFSDQLVASGMNMKDVFVEFMLSPWFRTHAIDPASLTSTQDAAHALVGLGDEKLLTPEQLAQKTTALTGFTWESNLDFSTSQVNSGLADNYKMFYGGIDSAGVTERSLEITPLMSTVPKTHGLEAACPIVLQEFLLPDSSRKLFDGIDSYLIPTTEANSLYELQTSTSPPDTEISVIAQLPAGSTNFSVLLDANTCDWDEAAQQCRSNSGLIVDKIRINSPSGSGTTFQASRNSTVIDESCSYSDDSSQDVIFYSSCKVSFPYTVSSAGEYEVVATVRAFREGEDSPITRSMNVVVGADSTEDYIDSTAAGATQIKQKLVDLHATLLGQEYSINSEEITDAYTLFVESLEERQADPDLIDNINWNQQEQCAWWADSVTPFDGVPTDVPLNETIIDENGYPYISVTEEVNDLATEGGFDTLHTKSAWTTVITYLLTHYYYLYE